MAWLRRIWTALPRSSRENRTAETIPLSLEECIDVAGDMTRTANQIRMGIAVSKIENLKGRDEESS